MSDYVKILEWAVDVIEEMCSLGATVRPVSYKQIKRIAPDLSRNTILNRMATLEKVRWLTKTDDGWVLGPKAMQFGDDVCSAHQRALPLATETFQRFRKVN